MMEGLLDQAAAMAAELTRQVEQSKAEVAAQAWLIEDARAVLTILAGHAHRLRDAMSVTDAAGAYLDGVQEMQDFTVEPRLRAEAVDGKNKEDREYRFRELAAADKEWQDANEVVRTATAALTAAKTAQEGLVWEGKNAGKRAELLAALLNGKGRKR